MITVYTKLNGKLAQWDVETSDMKIALEAAKDELPPNHRVAILAVVPKQLEAA